MCSHTRAQGGGFFRGETGILMTNGRWLALMALITFATIFALPFIKNEIAALAAVFALLIFDLLVVYGTMS